MKKIVAVMVLSVISMSAFCQKKSETVTPVSPVLRSSGPKGYDAPPGLRMRNNGRVMTILGSALFVGGVFVLASADEMYYTATAGSNGTETEGDPKAAVGILMITGGAGLAIPGIIMWSKGGKKYKAHQAAQVTSFNLKGAGFSIRHRF